jgi:Zn-dependent protease
MSQKWEYLVPLVAILLLSMMLHEIAHGYVAYKLGDPTAKSRGRLSLNPIRHLDPLGTVMFVLTYLAGGFIFGWAKPVPVSPYYFRNRQRGMLLVGLAGPLTNFLIAVVFWVILTVFSPALTAPGSVRYAVGSILFLAFEVNVVLGIFNLIPIPPLDGSRVVGGILPRGAYQVWVSIDRYGMYILIILLILVAYSRLGNQISVGYEALFRTLLPAYF